MTIEISPSDRGPILWRPFFSRQLWFAWPMIAIGLAMQHAWRLAPDGGESRYAAPAWSATARGPRKVALLIGIGDYRAFRKEGPSGEQDLNGPPNDVYVMRRLLRGWGFEDAGSANTRVLVDAAASREGILKAFDWAVQQADQPNDVLVVYFSGHGTYTPDRDGDERRLDPLDTFDEALVPWDAPRGTTRPEAGPSLVTDDLIAERLINRLKTKRVTILLDACFSGSATRGAPLEYVRARGPQPQDGRGSSVAFDFRDGNRYTFLSAASSNQQAEERAFPIDSGKTVVHGVFTRALVEVLNRSDRPLRWDALFPILIRKVRESGAAQQPQLEGAGEERIFSTAAEDVAPKPFMVVTRQFGDSIEVDEGDLMGLRAGARLYLHHPTESALAGATAGTARVIHLTDSSAIAVLDSSVGPVAKGFRATRAALPTGVSLPQSIAVHFAGSDHVGLPNVISGIRLRPSADPRAPVWVTRDGGTLRIFARGHEIHPLRTDASAEELRCQLARGITATILAGLPSESADAREIAVFARVTPYGRAPTSAPQTVDTLQPEPILIGGREYSLWAYAEGPPGTRLYVTSTWSGYTGTPSPTPLSGLPTMQPVGQWVRLQDFGIGAPFDFDVITVLASVEPYSFATLQAVVAPECGGDTRKGEVLIRRTAAGWASARIEFTQVRTPQDSATLAAKRVRRVP